MNLIINNSSCIVSSPTDEVRKFIHKKLSYIDKAKQFQLKRMSKNSYMRKQPIYEQLKAEINGKLYNDNGTDISFSSSFYYLLEKVEFNNVTDSRVETGSVIALPWVTKPHDARDYQDEAVSLMMKNWRGIINLATGLGKTLLTIHLIKQYRRKTLIICPSTSVAQQFYEQCCNAWGTNRIGFYGGGKKKINDITIGIAASINNDIEIIKKEDWGLVIADETHHTPATTFFNIAANLSHVGKFFGLTATAYRSDGKDILINAGCGGILINRDIKWGVDNKWLAEPVFLIRKIASEGRDYDDKLKSYKEHVLNNKAVKDQILADIKALIDSGKTTLVLVDEIAHGRELADALGLKLATGIDKRSQEYVDELNAGTVKGLIGVDSKIGEGTDTRTVDCVVLANFVASKGPVIQAIGRGLRKQGTKTKCLILDYVLEGSNTLNRHAYQRIKYYRELTDKVKIIR